MFSGVGRFPLPRLLRDGAGPAVFDFQLHVAVAVVFVDAGFDGKVDFQAGGEVVEPVGLVEGDAAHEGVVLFDLELEVVGGFAYAAGGAGDFDGLAEENWSAVALAEGAES